MMNDDGGDKNEQEFRGLNISQILSPAKLTPKLDSVKSSRAESTLRWLLFREGVMLLRRTISPRYATGRERPVDLV